MTKIRERSTSAGARITQRQATSFRLRRHYLTERAPRGQLLSVVDGMAGAQAQVLGAARLSLWARLRDLDPEDVERALWRDRTLVRAWCMRRTLYLLPGGTVAIYVRGSARRAEKEIRWAHNHGVSKRRLERLLGGVLAALDEPYTRSELAERVGRSLGLPIRWAPGGGWGSDRPVPWLTLGGTSLPTHYLLHLAGARGVLCSGPTRGGEATFVRADAWIPGWEDAPGARAEEELLRAYLRTFGPATLDDFRAWTGMRKVDARGIWGRLEGELTPIDVEGRATWALRVDLSELARSDGGPSSVRLLPYFDSFVLGHEDRTHLVRSGEVGHVYRPQGWVAPVVLIDGRVRGIWRHSLKGRDLSVRVEAFGPLGPEVRRAIRVEAEDLARFLGCSDAEVVLARIAAGSRGATPARRARELSSSP